jgi:hypothetical protein
MEEITGDTFPYSLLYNDLPSTPIDFYEEANHIRGPQTNGKPQFRI